MIGSVCFDVVFCFVDLTIISLLSYTGLPSNCAGLTSSNCMSNPLLFTMKPYVFDSNGLLPGSKGDKADLPSLGYSTIRFSDEQDGHRGELDKFCGLERGFFFCAVLVMYVPILFVYTSHQLIRHSLAYIMTMMLSIFRICDLNYTRNSEVQLLLDEREESLRLELKLQDQELRSQPSSPVTAPDPMLTSRGSNAEEAAAAAAVMHPSRSRPTIITSLSSSSMPSSSRSMGVNLSSLPVASDHRHVYANMLPVQSVASSLAPVDRLTSNIDATDVQANMAMISDGSRYHGGNQVDNNQLPPYSPGNIRTMPGHGHEDNDIRLSEYVKGETRAQDMKDAGGY